MSLCLSFTDQTDNLLPLFLAFARRVHPMLDCIDEVKKISDLRGPADLWVNKYCSPFNKILLLSDFSQWNHVPVAHGPI